MHHHHHHSNIPTGSDVVARGNPKLTIVIASITCTLAFSFCIFFIIAALVIVRVQETPWPFMLIPFIAIPVIIMGISVFILVKTIQNARRAMNAQQTDGPYEFEDKYEDQFTSKED